MLMYIEFWNDLLRARVDQTLETLKYWHGSSSDRESPVSTSDGEHEGKFVTAPLGCRSDDLIWNESSASFLPRSPHTPKLLVLSICASPLPLSLVISDRVCRRQSYVGGLLCLRQALRLWVSRERLLYV